MDTALLSVFSSVYTGFDLLTILYWFLAGLVVIMLLRKTGLLHRKAKWHKALVCLYYIYIPLVFIGCGILWSAVHAADYAIRDNLTQARSSIIQSSVNYADGSWKKVLSVFRKEPGISPKDLCRTLAREYTDDLTAGLLSSEYTAFLKPLVSGIKEGLTLSIASMLEEKVIAKVSDRARLNPDLLRTLWGRDIVESLRGGLVYDLIFNQVQQITKPLYAKIKIMLALFLFPVFLEIGLAILFRSRKRHATHLAK